MNKDVNTVNRINSLVHRFASEEARNKFEEEMTKFSNELINRGYYIKCSFCEAPIINAGKNKSKCLFCGSIT